MVIKLGNSFYLEILEEKEAFSSEKKICEQVKNQLQFKYGDVDQQHFNVKYSSVGWLGRKMIALPTAAWIGVVQTSYHLALVVLIGIPLLCLGKAEHLKVQVFNLARDFQGCYGCLVSLFNDRYGQFHIQESEFQKACYQYFMADHGINKEIVLSKWEEEISPVQELGQDLESLNESDDEIFRIKEDLTLEELKLEHKNEMECIESLNDALRNDINIIAFNRLKKRKIKHQERVQRLVQLIKIKESKVGLGEGDINEKGEAAEKIKPVRGVTFSPIKSILLID